MNINEKINFRGFVARAAAMTEKQFKEKVSKLGIGVTGAFKNELKAVGQVKGGQPLIEISYNYYADFTAWGVGKGIAIGDQSTARLVGGGRKQKNWQLQTFASRNLIADQLSYKYANRMEEVVKMGLPDSIIMKF